MSTPKRIDINGTGRIIAALPLASNGASERTPQAGLRSLPIDIDNTAGQVILAYRPMSTNQAVAGAITVTEY